MARDPGFATWAVSAYSVTSSGRPVVLVEHAAETISSRHWTGRHPNLLGRLAGSPLPKPLVRAGIVVVHDELAQHPLQVPTTEDQQGWAGPINVGRCTLLQRHGPEMTATVG